MYDVFLSYNRNDRELVEAIALRLAEHGLELFFDAWHLVPGTPWQESLEVALGQSRACVVFFGPAGLGPWQKEELRAVLDSRVSSPELRVIPVLLPGAVRPRQAELPLFLRRFTWVELRSLDDRADLERLIRGIHGLAPGRSEPTTPETFSSNPFAATAFKSVVSGAYDHTVRLWDLTSGFSKTFEGRSNITSLAASRDRRLIASGSQGEVKIWDLERTGSPKILMDGSSFVSQLAFVEPDLLVSGDERGVLRVREVSSGRTLQLWTHHSKGISCLEVLSDGRVATGSNDGTVCVWRLDQPNPVHVLAGHTNFVTSLAIDPEAQILVSASHDRTLVLWDLEKGRKVRVLRGHTDYVETVCLLSDRRAASGSHDRTIRIWDLDSGEAVRVIHGHVNWILDLLLESSGRLISSSLDYTIRIWDLESGECRKTLSPQTPPPGRLRSALSLAPAKAPLVLLEHNRIASVCKSRAIQIWDLKSGDQLRALEGHLNYVRVMKGI